MAIFNPDVPDVASDYTRNSQGYASDKSLSGLFESGANLFQTAVEGADKLFKKVIRDESTKQVDIERDRELDRGAAKMRGDLPPPGVRGPIDATANNLATMKRAQESGQIGDSHYQIALDAAARRMRERYPGHREYIDNVFQDLTGHTPANQAIQLMKSELNKEGKNSERLNELHYARDHGVEVLVKAMADGSIEKISTEQIRAMNAQDGMLRAKLSNAKNTLELDNVQDANSQRKVLDKTQGLALEGITARQRNITEAQGLTWDRIQGLKTQALEAGEAGKPVPQQVEQQLALAIDKYKEEETSKAADLLKQTVKLKDGKEVTLGEAMGTKNVDDYFKAIKMHLDTTTDMKKFKINAAFNETTKDSNLSELLFSAPEVGRAHAYVQQVSPQVANALTLGSGTAIKSYQESMLQFIFHKLPGKSDFSDDVKESSDALRRAGKPEKEIAEKEQEAVYRMTNAIKLPTATPKDLDMLVRKLYGGNTSKDFYANASQPQKEALFTKMIDSKVTEAIFRTGDAKMIDTYKSWTDRVVGDRIDSDAKSIKNVLSQGKDFRYSVDYNPESQQFSVVDKGKRTSGQTSDMGDVVMRAKAENYTNSLNRTIAHWSPVADRIGLTSQQRDQVLQKIFRLPGTNIDLKTMKVME